MVSVLVIRRQGGSFILLRKKARMSTRGKILSSNTGTFSWKHWIIVIPARLASTRLPQKPLQDLCGAPLVVRVYQRLKPIIDMGALAIVATDSLQVKQACEPYNIPCELTKTDHKSGTDRVHEVSSRHSQPFILNVQGDEPFVDVETLQKLAESMAMPRQNPIEMGTVVYRNPHRNDFNNPNVVKAVISEDKAIYFSRAPIPFHRDDTFTGFWQHQGIYGFRKACLEKFSQYPEHPLEKLEKLEQLRAIGHGIAILTVESKHAAIGIDTPFDLEEARELYSKT